MIWYILLVIFGIVYVVLEVLLFTFLLQFDDKASSIGCRFEDYRNYIKMLFKKMKKNAMMLVVTQK